MKVQQSLACRVQFNIVKQCISSYVRITNRIASVQAQNHPIKLSMTLLIEFTSSWFYTTARLSSVFSVLLVGMKCPLVLKYILIKLFMSLKIVIATKQSERCRIQHFRVSSTSADNDLLLCGRLNPPQYSYGSCPSIGVASYGALGHVPPLDFQLVKILREQIRKMYKNNAIFAQFLSIFGPFFVIFCPQFSSGSNYSFQNRSPINFNSTRTSDSGKTGS